MALPPEKALSRDAYTIGWICALYTEYTAARVMLDEQHPKLEDASPNLRDDNHYTLGRIGKNNVVIGVLPDGDYGLTSAASVATNLVSSFPNVRIGLMVGIAGGAPVPGKNDIRLGDVVVSSAYDGYSGVLQYDFGRAEQDGDLKLTRALNQPPVALRTSLAGLRSRFEEDGNGLDDLVTEILSKKKLLRKKYKRPPSSPDLLFRPHVVHNAGGSCHDCPQDEESLFIRPSRDQEEEDTIQVHYGLIATANTLMKDANARDRLAKDHGVMCFEMEAAGLMNTFPCLVIRGICDYSDSHKNYEWQGFAAMTAAGFAKALIEELAPASVQREAKVIDVIEGKLDELNTKWKWRSF